MLKRYDTLFSVNDISLILFSLHTYRESRKEIIDSGVLGEKLAESFSDDINRLDALMHIFRYYGELVDDEDN